MNNYRTTKTKLRRMGGHWYEADTPAGTFTIERLDRAEWFVTWPGRFTADEVCSSLKAATEMIRKATGG